MLLRLVVYYKFKVGIAGELQAGESRQDSVLNQKAIKINFQTKFQQRKAFLHVIVFLSRYLLKQNK